MVCSDVSGFGPRILTWFLAPLEETAGADVATSGGGMLLKTELQAREDLVAGHHQWGWKRKKEIKRSEGRVPVKGGRGLDGLDIRTQAQDGYASKPRVGSCVSRERRACRGPPAAIP